MPLPQKSQEAATRDLSPHRDLITTPELANPPPWFVASPTKMAYPVHDLGNVDARDSFSDLGQSFTSRTADDWADCANSEDWGSPPSPCGGTLQDEEKTAGPDGLVADGTP